MQNLHSEIENQKAEVDDLVELGRKLGSVVGDEDSEDVEGRIGAVVQRFDRLGSTSLAVGRLLEEMAEGVGGFLNDTDALASWMVDAESRLHQSHSLSVYNDELQEQGAALLVQPSFLLATLPLGSLVLS